MKVGNTGCRNVFCCAGPPFLAVAMFALASFKRAQTPIRHVLFTVLLDLLSGITNRAYRGKMYSFNINSFLQAGKIISVKSNTYFL